MSGRARPDDPLATWCEGRVEGVCTGRAVLRHHLAGRQKSEALPDPDARENTVDLCDPCHRWAHANPKKAKKAGLMRSRLAVPQHDNDNDDESGLFGLGQDWGDGRR